MLLIQMVNGAVNHFQRKLQKKYFVEEKLYFLTQSSPHINCPQL